MHVPIFDDAEMDDIIERMLAEQKAAEEELLKYKTSPEYIKHLSDMVTELKENGMFVWDGYPTPDWKLPVPFDKMDDFVCALIHNVEGVDDDEAFFSTTEYYCGDILVKEISGQGTIHKLFYKGN